jgi:hypothetical protein
LVEDGTALLDQLVDPVKLEVPPASLVFKVTVAALTRPGLTQVRRKAIKTALRACFKSGIQGGLGLEVLS